MFGFERLGPYQKAEDYVIKVYEILNGIRGDYELKDQLKRASLSITCNLAEGYSRMTPKDQKHFFTMARSSLHECASLVTILFRLGHIKASVKDEMIGSLSSISAFLWKMIKHRE